MNLKAKQSSSSISAYCYYIFFCFFFLSFRISNTLNPTTDPSEVKALNSIFEKWNVQASQLGNISGEEPCSGSAISVATVNDDTLNLAIKCDCSYNNNNTCHITQLRVYDLNKNGLIPKEIEDLRYLTYLKIDKNNFTGTLPASIGNLSELQFLSLAGNAFNGNIPKELGNLKNLSMLSISVNSFSGTLPPELGNLVNLEELYVDRSGLSGNIPSTFAHLLNMKILSATYIHLTGKIPDFIGNWTKLEKLIFQGNLLEGPIPSSFSKLASLKTLDLRVNNLTGQIPSALFNLSSLEYFWIDSSGLGGEIPLTFSNLQNLRGLTARDVPLTGKIPDFIGNWTKLEDLRFHGNSFEGPIPSGFSKLTSLKILWICDLQNKSSSLDFIKNLTNLKDLVLRNALITGNIPDIGEFKSLEKLDLSFNNLTGPIPSSLFIMSSLIYLFLGNNSLSGTLSSEKIGTVQNLDLSYNNLSGAFPTWITNFNLQPNLVGNNFTFDSSSISNNWGLNCLQRNFLCNRNSPIYADFSINCGGLEITIDGTVYEKENDVLDAASFFVESFGKWAVSNVGKYDLEDTSQSDLWENNSIQVTGTQTPELFRTSRKSPSSLRYYGLGLQNGHYTINMLFAETIYKDRSSRVRESLGKRVFDIYIQGILRQKDFDISKEAGGVNKAIQKNFSAIVLENYLEIHLFWDGKGTMNISKHINLGPMISAIRVVSDFHPTVSEPTRLIVGIVVPIVLVSLILIFAVLYMKRKLNKDDEEELLGVGATVNTFSYVELRTGTEDFIPSNKLGEGGFGSVYKGKLYDGRTVAVKQLSVASRQGTSQFITEIATISAVQHRNLVKLYGCCIEGNRRLLVYEYLEHKSLDQALFGNSELHLDWPIRFNICLETARGLTYLHEESRPRIIHRDVKASNILLDGELCPRISDFGLAKLYDDKKTHISTRIAGTIGYLAPEYAMRGHLTEKADVFNFGVVALEILSGRPNSDDRLKTEKIYLLEWAWTLYEQNQALGLMDPKLTEFDEDEASRVIGVALLCTQASPMMRPRMSRVVGMLAGDIEVGIVTSKPSYLTDWNFEDISSNFLNEDDATHPLTAYMSSNSQNDNTSIDLQRNDPMLSHISLSESMISEVIGDGR